jgi:arabinofuranosyltransferase
LVAKEKPIIQYLVISLALIGFGVVVLRSAWVSDDAYITFRTVDNFIHGYGLTWNVAERVQVYTHPLWMFLLSGVVFFTREVFFSGQVLSILISLATVALVAIRGSRSLPAALLGVITLTLSKAFVDYSTSGLENPLTHLIFATFLLIFLSAELTPRTIFFLSLMAALGITNRMDTALLFAPVLTYALFEVRSPRALGAAVAGMAPFVLWELFSLFYYGFPFPNTAYAKLHSGLADRTTLLQQGVYYLGNSLRWDPLTLVTILLGIGSVIVARAWRNLPVAIGVALYIFYIVWIGGDFMSGRFLAAPILASVVLLVHTQRTERSFVAMGLVGLVLALGLLSPRCPVFVGTAREPAEWVDPNRITDERLNYYQNTGLLLALQGADLPDHDWALEGRAAREAGPAVVQKGSVGFFGYFAGPEVHVVDLLALGDPLLARLPPADPRSGLGHLGRLVPEGYVESLEAGDNRLADEDLARYYDKLSLLTRGDLFAPGRLAEIWRFNRGDYDVHRDDYAYFHGERFVRRFEVINPTDFSHVTIYAWNGEAAEAFLLDDASAPGDVYTITWTITAAGVRFDGPSVRQVSSGQPLTDEAILNLGVYFSPGPELTSYDIYERRFWFEIAESGQLDVILPGMEWHNAAAPGGVWVSEDIDPVLRELP